jgi:hypothetical protein
VTSHAEGGALDIHPHLLNCLSKVPQVQFGTFVDGFAQLNDNANTFNFNIEMAIDNFYNSFQKPYNDSNNHPTRTLTPNTQIESPKSMPWWFPSRNPNHIHFNNSKFQPQTLEKIQMFCIRFHPI